MQDPASGLSSSKLSALSVVVFGEPITVSELAEAEQVSTPTISRLIKDLEAAGLVKRRRDRLDRRVQQVRATSKGKQLLHKGRRRRVKMLARDLAGLSKRERSTLAEAAEILARLNLPRQHPRQAT